MNSQSAKAMQNYWTLLHLKADGSYHSRPLLAAEAFFQTQFPHSANLNDRQIQTHLFTHPDRLAQLCLRCYISHEILQVCLSLVNQFGQTYQFQIKDLLPLVLDDDGRLATNPYQPLTLRILQGFNPNSGSLRNWIIRLVRQDPPVQEFMLGQGLHLISDWAILNDTSPNSLRRIYSQFYSLTESEIAAAAQLLDSYQLIYLNDRRQQGDRKRCTTPTPEQLDRIAQHIQATSRTANPPASVMSQLLNMAQKLRQYRIHRRGGKSQQSELEVSLDIPETAEQLEYEASQQNPSTELDSNSAATFITAYRQELLIALDRALATVVQDRIQKQPKKAQPFLIALEKFHCQHQSMGEIAKAIGANRQDDISRLLKLKDFRADVRHLMLHALKTFAQAQANIYADPDQLQDLDTAIEAAIGEQLDALITAAQKEAATAKGYVKPTLFTDRLCTYLQGIIDDP